MHSPRSLATGATVYQAIEVSVVIPAKDRAHTLPYCLESVLAQTRPAQEVIVVDDHSTDQTKQVIDSFADRGVRYLPLTDGVGAQAARNAGVAAARSSWIAFQDSDDRWLPHKLELQAAALDAAGGSPDLIVHTAAYKVDVRSGRREVLAVPRFEGRCYARLLTRPGPMFPGLLVHRAALDRIGHLDVACPSYQEWDTAIRLAAHGKLIYLDAPQFEWLWHEGATISKDGERGLRGHEYVLLKHRNEIVRVHGRLGWRLAVCDLVSAALRSGAEAWAVRLANEHLPRPAAQLAKLLSRRGSLPRGGSRLLRLASHLPG